MEALKEMVLQISILSLITGVITSLKPYGKFTPQLKLFTALIMFTGILSPFFSSIKNMNTDFDCNITPEKNVQELNAAADEAVLRLAEDELERELKLKLAEEAVPCSEIEVNMNTNEDESINISNVTIISTKPAEAEMIIRNELGEEVEIYAEENY